MNHLPPSDGEWCGHCGRAAGEGHPGCADHLAMEPPRYCAACRRRLKVQVTPLGWTAQCSRHGTSAS